MVQVIPAVSSISDTPPTSNLDKLVTFLEVNDCGNPKYSVKEIRMCYTVTRLLLIQTTNELDKSLANTWVAGRTVEQLISNINVIIEGFENASK